MTFDYNTIGVGFGPANIAVAIAMEEMGLSQSIHFFEAEPASIWQKGMLIEGSDIQNHPLRDLVTPSNPRSRYTFVNYLFENGRLFEHLNLGLAHPYRLEYAKYIEWVAGHFRHLVSYNTPITDISMVRNNKGKGIGYRVTDEQGNKFTSRSLIIATGRTPFIPQPFAATASPKVGHISNYLESVEKVLSVNRSARIAVIGSSQSAVEAILHLSDNYPDARITGILRSFGYRLKDTSPFTGEVYFPEFVDLFFGAGEAEKARLNKDLYYTNYGAVDGDVLDTLYRKMYMQRLAGRQKIVLHRVAEVLECREEEEGLTLTIRKLESAALQYEQFDLVLLATGFKNIGTKENEEPYPSQLSNLIPYASLDHHSLIRVDYEYRLVMKDTVDPDANCFLNGLCESSHGMGDAGSFSLLALRSKRIAGVIGQQPALHHAQPLPTII